MGRFSFWNYGRNKYNFNQNWRTIVTWSKTSSPIYGMLCRTVSSSTCERLKSMISFFTFELFFNVGKNVWTTFSNNYQPHHEVLLQRDPAVHSWDRIDSVDDLDGDWLYFSFGVLSLRATNELRVWRRIFGTNPGWRHFLCCLKIEKTW